ncbi:putative FAD NAD -binding domain-containing protein [Rosellinia necatrix]|uniref:Putative FAD NAD-binding domain-containing protein n=1 Tax=Rosellinia necatrix TaxID=77044 RepID=A0A1W2TKA7_ROSNE|nr:putative FAD NAD -binding domain-containing protein [Rosellinia necatrix]
MPCKVVIIGGSLAGLMCGIALKHAGHSVEIIEREGNVRQSHMAGVCLGLDAREYLSRHDRLAQVFTHRSNRLQTLNSGQPLKIFVNIIRDITSWDVYYFRLRACFDGRASMMYPSPPPPEVTDGPATYSCRKEVVGIERAPDDTGGGMALKVLDCETKQLADVRADLVIGADGPDSFVRSKYLPGTERRYVGYIAWRGTVPESEVSDATREIFKRSVTLQLMHLQHCIMYTIPGPDGSLEPGERLFNFLWYTNETPAALEEIMIDSKTGQRHHNIVPAGHVRPDIWTRRLEEARRIPLTAPFLEIMEKIDRPFIQRITDFRAPRAAFEDGRVLLVGDALSLFRPHTAFSGTQAAFDALQVADYVAGAITLREWEERVLRYATLHSSQTTWWGSYYQQHKVVALLYAVRYWFHCGIDRLKAWWHGQEPLLRTSVGKVVEYEL